MLRTGLSACKFTRVADNNNSRGDESRNAHEDFRKSGRNSVLGDVRTVNACACVLPAVHQSKSIWVTMVQLENRTHKPYRGKERILRQVTLRCWGWGLQGGARRRSGSRHEAFCMHSNADGNVAAAAGLHIVVTVAVGVGLLWHVVQPTLPRLRLGHEGRGRGGVVSVEGYINEGRT